MISLNEINDLNYYVSFYFIFLCHTVDLYLLRLNVLMEKLFRPQPLRNIKEEGILRREAYHLAEKAIYLKQHRSAQMVF